MSATFSSSGKKKVPGQTVIVTCARHPDRDQSNVDKVWACTACSWIQLAAAHGLFPNADGRLPMLVLK